MPTVAPASSTAPGQPLVELRGARIGHGRRALTPAFDLELRAGEFVALAGPNGAGKSTLARTLMGLLPPIEGERRAGLPGRPLRFGYVPQRERLDDLWPFSALDIALMGAVPSLRPFQPFGRKLRARAREVLEQVGIGAMADRPFRSLSGGQQQRALIARALLADPDLLVLDEPTNHLDVPGELAVYDLLGALHRAAPGRALFVITHHLEPVLPLATRILVLRPGQAPVGGTVEEMAASGALHDLRVPRWEGGRP